MKSLDLTLPTPAENLACDEALLDVCEAGEEWGVLRFYESAVPFVVVGYGNRVAAEVDVAACSAERVPVLRRLSGGGTVVLGPGCLAYTLVLPYGAHPELTTVPGSNRFIMSRQRTALSEVLGSPVEVRGHTDLAVAGLKVSGNAQRRRQRTLLFHGTLLLDFDLSIVGRLLRPPSQEPAYRQGRHHRDFMTNLRVPATEAKAALRRTWEAHETWERSVEGRVGELMEARYGRPDWHQRR